MDKRFLSAYTDPARIRLLGRLVYPFCLLNRVRLMAAENPIVLGSDRVRPIDLLIAVKVCADEDLGRLTMRDHWELFRMTRSEEYFSKQLDRFVAYTLVQAWPKFWEKERTKSSGSGTPWPLTVVCNLVANGVTIEQAWTMPESQAIWMNCGMAMMNGADLKVLSTEEEDFLKNLDETK
jgi:hypothetical protein